MDKAEQPTARALKPCPFCGGEAEIAEIEGGIGALFYASCKDDDCCGYHIEPWVKYARRIEAATAWNARTTSLAAQDGLVEAARKAVVAYAFHECQPDKGHIFSWLDDRAQEIAQAALSAIKEQHHD